MASSGHSKCSAANLTICSRASLPANSTALPITVVERLDSASLNVVSLWSQFSPRHDQTAQAIILIRDDYPQECSEARYAVVQILVVDPTCVSRSVAPVKRRLAKDTGSAEC